MSRDITEIYPTRYADSLKILLYFIARYGLFIGGIVLTSIITEFFNNVALGFFCLVPSAVFELIYTSNFKELIEKQRQLYRFTPSRDIEWNIVKHKEYKEIRKQEIKWWEFWL